MKNCFNVCLFLLVNCLVLGNGQTLLDIASRRTSNTCQVAEDCPLNAYCETSKPGYRGYCVCREGFIIARTNGAIKQCIKVARNINDTCEQDEQCTVIFSSQSECRDGACQCLPTAHFKENSCYHTAELGDRCEFSNSCYIGPKYPIFCVSGYCECDLNQRPNGDSTGCVNIKRLGEGCVDDGECFVENARCHGVCRCQIKYVLSENQTACLKAAYNLFDECQESVQCTDLLPNTSCENGKCVCNAGYHQANQKCWKSAYLDEFCEVDQHCQVTPASACIEGVCGCPQGLKSPQSCTGRAPSRTAAVSLVALSLITFFITTLYNIS